MGRNDTPPASVRQLVEWLQAIVRDLETLEAAPVADALDGPGSISHGRAPHSTGNGLLASTRPAARMFASGAELVESVQRMRERFVAEAGAGVHQRWRTPAHSQTAAAGLPADPEAPAMKWRVRRFLCIIAARWRDPALSAARVAEELGVTPTWMSRIVKEQTGRGFLSHVDAYRLPAATQLLLETTASEKEIAAAVGYSGLGQFSARFKARYGVTPGAYREHLLAQHHVTTPPPDYKCVSRPQVTRGSRTSYARVR